MATSPTNSWQLLGQWSDISWGHVHKDCRCQEYTLQWPGKLSHNVKVYRLVSVGLRPRMWAFNVKTQPKHSHPKQTTQTPTSRSNLYVWMGKWITGTETLPAHALTRTSATQCPRHHLRLVWREQTQGEYSYVLPWGFFKKPLRDANLSTE